MESKTKKRKLFTLCYIHEHPRILLCLKKRGFGTGLWTGSGGKVMEGETIEEGAAREFLEETGIKVSPHEGGLEKFGVIDFEFSNTDEIMEVHVFKALSWSGEPTETEEMRPQWFYVDEIPFKGMWSDSLFWLPLFIKGKRFRARFLFDKPSTPEYSARILEREVTEVADLG